MLLDPVFALRPNFKASTKTHFSASTKVLLKTGIGTKSMKTKIYNYKRALTNWSSNTI